MRESWQDRWKEDFDCPRAEGGQGSVIRVRNVETGQAGALKRIHPMSQESTERRQRMAEEVRALTTVDGPGIPRIIEHNMEAVEETNTVLYFVSEWIDGRTLTQYVNGKARSMEEALDLTRQLTTIVGRCHSKQVYHRDIKSDNVILRADGSLVLVDFGTAWCSDREEGRFATEMGQELGNRFLRLPDLAAGRERHDPRADITFVVGIFYYLLTGTAPRILVDEKMRPPHVACVGSFLPEITSDRRWQAVCRVLDVGFQPSVNMRFQTADQLLNKLNEIMTCDSSSPDEANEPEIALRDYSELLARAEIQTRIGIEKAMLEIARNLEDMLRNCALESGLMSTHNAGNACVDMPGRRVKFTYVLTRPDMTQPQTELLHVIELVGTNGSEVEASFAIDKGQTTIYYRGPSADTKTLQDRVRLQGPDMFATTVRNLTKKMEKAFGQ